MGGPGSGCATFLKMLANQHNTYRVVQVVMTNEFMTLDPEYSNPIPRGSGYENITLDSQVCAVGALSLESPWPGISDAPNPVLTASGVTCGG